MTPEIVDAGDMGQEAGGARHLLVAEDDDTQEQKPEHDGGDAPDGDAPLQAAALDHTFGVENHWSLTVCGPDEPAQRWRSGGLKRPSRLLVGGRLGLSLALGRALALGLGCRLLVALLGLATLGLT